MNPETPGARILVVEDTMENIQLVSAILREAGYRINIARNGKSALELVKKLPFDLILLDIVMPEMDGFECCKLLKEDPSTKAIPIIFLSSSSEKDDISEGLKIGAVDYVFKPFTTSGLLSRIKTHLSIASFHKA